MSLKNAWRRYAEQRLESDEMTCPVCSGLYTDHTDCRRFAAYLESHGVHLKEGETKSMSTIVDFPATYKLCEHCEGVLVVDAVGVDRKLGVSLDPSHVDISRGDHVERVYCARCGTLHHPGRVGLPVG